MYCKLIKLTSNGKASYQSYARRQAVPGASACQRQHESRGLQKGHSPLGAGPGQDAGCGFCHPLGQLRNGAQVAQQLSAAGFLFAAGPGPSGGDRRGAAGQGDGPGLQRTAQGPRPLEPAAAGRPSRGAGLLPASFLPLRRRSAQKNELKPHLRRSWCIGRINSRFLAQMEQLLALYAQPYDELYPLLCFDERPCFLIGQVIEPLAPQPAKPAKEHYAYQKNGSCSLLAAIEPLTGQRLAQVQAQRTKKEYTHFMQALAQHYPQAKKIRLVQDNLNTHDASAFYENLPAGEARELAERFEFHYTPKSASWLNMIEIEFSAISRLCLQRRIPSQQELEEQVLALVEERQSKGIKINWQFSVQDARKKLNRHYSQVNPDNKQYLKT